MVYALYIDFPLDCFRDYGMQQTQVHADFIFTWPTYLLLILTAQFIGVCNHKLRHGGGRLKISTREHQLTFWLVYVKRLQANDNNARTICQGAFPGLSSKAHVIA